MPKGYGCVHWVGDMDGSTGLYFNAGGNWILAEISTIGIDSERPAPTAYVKDCVINSALGDTSTVIKYIVNGSTVKTITLTAAQALYAIDDSVTITDTIAFEYDAGTAPDRTVIDVFFEEDDLAQLHDWGADLTTSGNYARARDEPGAGQRGSIGKRTENPIARACTTVRMVGDTETGGATTDFRLIDDGSSIDDILNVGAGAFSSALDGDSVAQKSAMSAEYEGGTAPNKSKLVVAYSQTGGAPTVHCCKWAGTWDGTGRHVQYQANAVASDVAGAAQSAAYVRGAGTMGDIVLLVSTSGGTIKLIKNSSTVATFTVSTTAHVETVNESVAAGDLVQVEYDAGTAPGMSTVAAAIVGAIPCTLADGAKAGDTISLLLLDALASVTDGAKAGDTLSLLLTVAALTIADGAKAGDTLSLIIAKPMTLTDGAKAGDTLSLILTTAVVSLVDGAKAGDTLSLLLLDALASFVDGAKAGDTLSLLLLDALASFVDGAKAGDTLSLKRILPTTIADGAKAGDTLSLTLPAGPILFESTSGDLVDLTGTAIEIAPVSRRRPGSSARAARGELNGEDRGATIDTLSVTIEVGDALKTSVAAFFADRVGMMNTWKFKDVRGAWRNVVRFGSPSLTWSRRAPSRWRTTFLVREEG